jgi:hypothetical protein
MSTLRPAIELKAEQPGNLSAGEETLRGIRPRRGKGSLHYLQSTSLSFSPRTGELVW